MTFLNIIKALLYGIIQGITEWLPISSTGHLLLVQNFLGFEGLQEGFLEIFDVVIQLGSILAVVVLFFNVLNPFSGKKSIQQKRETWSLWGKIIVACIPAGIAGILFEDAIDNALSSNYVIAAALIVYGVLFVLSGRMNTNPTIRTRRDITYKTAFLMGCCQMLALIPGTSRSGSTILGAILLLGVARSAAAEFSFFMAVPVMFGASALKLLKAGNLGGNEIGILAIAFIVSFVVSMFVIKFLMAYIKKHDFAAFGWYRIALGVLVLLLIVFGAIDAGSVRSV